MALPFNKRNKKSRKEWLTKNDIFSLDSIGDTSQAYVVLVENLSDFTDSELQTIYNLSFSQKFNTMVEASLTTGTPIATSELVQNSIRDYFTISENHAKIVKNLKKATTRIYQGIPAHFLNPDTNPTSENMVKNVYEAFLKTSDSRKFWTNDPDTISELEEQSKEGKKAAADALIAAQGRPVPKKALTDTEKTDLRQCAIITDLFKDQSFSAEGYPKYCTGNGSNPPYFRRILPIDPQNFGDSTLFVNRMLVSTGEKLYFHKCDSGIQKLNVNLGYVYYYEDENGIGQLKEIDLVTDSDVGASRDSYELFKYEQALVYAETSNNQGLDSLAIPNDLRSVPEIEKKIDELRASIFGQAETSDGKFFLKSTRITYDGTNPSTARSDVKVTLTFVLSGLTDLSEVSIVSKNDTLPDGGDIKLQDLVTLPVTGRGDGGPGAFLVNQYSPNYGRIRIKLLAAGDRQSIINDLTTIDHKLTRESATGVTTFEITYRGYFESMMNMPFNDALADEKTLIARDVREQVLKDAIKEKCQPATLREILRVNQQAIEAEKNNVSRRSFLTRLFERNKIFEVKFNSNYNPNLAFIDPRVSYVDTIKPLIPETVQELSKALSQITQDDEKKDELVLKGTKSTYCVYLGDILEVVSDCLYEGRTDAMRNNVSLLNLKFLVTPVQLPNPKDISSLLSINPLQIPVDIKFLTNWFHDTIVKKDLSFYPVGTFIRDLLERLVNDLIFETCFNSLLPDEAPPMLRVGYFSSTRTKFFEHEVQELAGGGPSIFNSYYMNINKPIRGLNFQSQPLIRRNGTFKIDTANGQNTTNYCVIYLQSPPYFRQIRKQKNSNGTIKDDPYVPTITYGTRNKDCNYVKNVSFSKTDSPFLREARYFNESYGNLSLLSNVYDLSFSFVDRKASTSFFPGNIINFVLKDWGAIRNKSVVKLEDSFGITTLRYDESNPHLLKSPANILGLGGYFIIKSVEYNRGETPQDFSINIKCKYLGSDAQPERRATGDTISVVKQDPNEDCLRLYDRAVRSYNALLDEDDKKKLAQTGAGAASQTNSPPTPTNVPSVTTPPTPPTTTSNAQRVTPPTTSTSASGPNPTPQQIQQEKLAKAVVLYSSLKDEIFQQVATIGYQPGFDGIYTTSDSYVKFKVESATKVLITEVLQRGEYLVNAQFGSMDDDTLPAKLTDQNFLENN